METLRFASSGLGLPKKWTLGLTGFMMGNILIQTYLLQEIRTKIICVFRLLKNLKLGQKVGKYFYFVKVFTLGR